jgi:eukaryotic-like serine/threonine-protein kinase
MQFFRFLFTRVFWINILIMVFTLILLSWGAYRWLKSFTLQGVETVLPDLRTFTVEEVEDTLLAMGLRFDILDSNEYFSEFPRSSVIEQYPPAGTTVKPNRRISLTLNAGGPKKVPIPDVVEKTRRRAIYDLESKGFVIGELVYVPYIGKDVVLGLRHRGEDVIYPTNFTRGTKFDLVIGMGLSSERVRVPYIKNLTLDAAHSKLKTFSLNLGAVIYDEDVRDSNNVFVYRQDPTPSWEAVLRMGGNVDVWVTEDKNKLSVDSLSFYKLNPHSDSLQMLVDPEFYDVE